MTNPVSEVLKQHLATAYDVPYLVTWFEGENNMLNASIVVADSDFKGTWADEPQEMSFLASMVEEIGHITLMEQVLDQVAFVSPNVFDPALSIVS